MSKDVEEIEHEMKKVAQPLATMDIDKESKYATKKQERFADSFFKHVVDYSKWITSIALAALTLIGTIFSKKGGLTNIFYSGSLILIFVSIIFSIVTIYCVLKFWKRNYDYYFDMKVYYSMLWALKNNLSLYTIEDCENQKNKMVEKVAKNTLFSMPELYTALLSFQILFFFFGMICYILGVNLQGVS